MSIESDLGLGYVNEWYQGAYFSIGNDVYTFKRMSPEENTIAVTKVVGNSWRGATLPAGCLESLDSFKWPQLGYRNLYSTSLDSRIVVFISSRRSVRRGLQDSLIDFDVLPIGMALTSGPIRNYVKSCNYAKEIFLPTFPTLEEGLASIREEGVAAFALSPRIAIGVDPYSESEDLAVYYKQRIIGSVSSENKVIIPAASLKKLPNKHLILKEMKTYA